MSTLDQGFNTICVIGLGYVGLPTAAVFASRGVDVLGVDTNETTVGLINDGKVHIVEPDLDIMVNGAVATGRLKAATTPAPADAFIIAVPTPFKEKHKPDLGYVEAAARSLAPVLKKGDLVIIESTSPVGTTQEMTRWLSEERPDLTFPNGEYDSEDEFDIFVAHSPERVLPGRVLIELTDNDRVIGGMTKRCSERSAALYAIAVNGKCLLTTAATAELVKLTENAYRDVNIAFANEISQVADHLGINVWEAIDLANHHPRVNILQPGPGVGGHCIAVDPWFIVDSAPEQTPLIQAARSVNDGKSGHVVKSVLEACQAFNQPTIACLGLSYKPDIDDLRESPAVDISAQLASLETPTLIVEPHIQELPKSLKNKPATELCHLDTALEKADILVLLVDHKVFKDLDTSRLEGKKVIDTRGIWR